MQSPSQPFSTLQWQSGISSTGTSPFKELSAYRLACASVAPRGCGVNDEQYNTRPACKIRPFLRTLWRLLEASHAGTASSIISNWNIYASRRSFHPFSCHAQVSARARRQALAKMFRKNNLDQSVAITRHVLLLSCLETTPTSIYPAQCIANNTALLRILLLCPPPPLPSRQGYRA